MKKNSENSNIKKIIVIIFSLIFILSIVGIIIVNCFVKEPLPYNRFFGILLLVLAVVYYFIITRKPDIFTESQQKQYLFPLNFNNFKDFLNYIDKNMSEIRMKKCGSNKNNNAILYYGTQFGSFGSWIENYIIFDFKEIKGSAIDELNNMFNTLKKINPNDENIGGRHHYIFIICVEKESETFKKLIDTTWHLERPLSFIQIVGCSFEKNVIYLTPPNFRIEGDRNFILRKVRRILKLKIRDRKKISI